MDYTQKITTKMPASNLKIDNERTLPAKQKRVKGKGQYARI